MISVHLCCLLENVKQAYGKAHTYKTISRVISKKKQFFWKHFTPHFTHVVCFLSAAHSHSNFPYKIIERQEKMSFLEIVFWVTIFYNSLPVCKLYILGYEIFSKHNFDSLSSRDLYFTKQIVYNCAPLLPNGYPEGMLLALRFNHIFSTNNSVEASEIWD